VTKTYHVTSGKRIVNRFMQTLIRIGIAPKGMHALTVAGRTSGKLYSTPVTLVEQGSDRWLVAPYGEVGWVRNARVTGQVALRRGRRMETVSIPLYICFGLLGLSLCIALIWRLASRRYSLPCPTWLRWLVELDNPFTESNRASTIVQQLDLQPAMKVLDLGCGPGRLTIPVAKLLAQGKVVAVDIQPGMLQRAQKKAQAAGLNNIRFLQAGAGGGKLGRNEYDRALLVTVLGEIPDRAAALKEIFEALKPGGILSVTEIIFDPHFQRRDTVLRLASTVGFREQKFVGNRLAFTLNLEKPYNA
jgi:protein-L-isoaspartate O-methyltransferase